MSVYFTFLCLRQNVCTCFKIPSVYFSWLQVKQLHGLKLNFLNHSILKGNICIKPFETKLHLNWRNDSIYLYLGIYRYTSIHKKEWKIFENGKNRRNTCRWNAFEIDFNIKRNDWCNVWKNFFIINRSEYYFDSRLVLNIITSVVLSKYIIFI